MTEERSRAEIMQDEKRKLFDEYGNYEFLYLFEKAGILDVVCEFIASRANFKVESEIHYDRLGGGRKIDFEKTVDKRASVSMGAKGAQIIVEFDEEIFNGVWSRGQYYDKDWEKWCGVGVRMTSSNWKSIRIQYVTKETAPFLGYGVKMKEIPQPPNKINRRKSGLAGILGLSEDVEIPNEPAKEPIFGLFINSLQVGVDGTLVELWDRSVNFPELKDSDNSTEWHSDHYFQV